MRSKGNEKCKAKTKPLAKGENTGTDDGGISLVVVMLELWSLQSCWWRDLLDGE